MAGSNEDRIKFCRYCDGVIEWGAEACPHCGESLALTNFDQMDFVGDGQPPPRVRGLRETPKVPGMRRRKRPAAESDPAPVKPPAVEPVDDAPPVVDPFDEPPPVVSPVDEDPPVVIPEGKGPPVIKPVDTGPPVVKPVAKGPPVLKPVGKKPPVVKPVGKGPPVLRPAGKRPPVVKPVGKGPPVVKPVGKQPPVVKPVDDGPPVVTPVDPHGSPLAECPVCDVEIESEDDVGGTCNACRNAVCVACLLRANGVKVAASSDRNRQRWLQHRKKVRASQIRCPACGRRGFRAS